MQAVPRYIFSVHISTLFLLCSSSCFLRWRTWKEKFLLHLNFLFPYTSLSSCILGHQNYKRFCPRTESSNIGIIMGINWILVKMFAHQGIIYRGVIMQTSYWVSYLCAYSTAQKLVNALAKPPYKLSLTDLVCFYYKESTNQQWWKSAPLFLSTSHLQIEWRAKVVWQHEARG